MRHETEHFQAFASLWRKLRKWRIWASCDFGKMNPFIIPLIIVTRAKGIVKWMALRACRSRIVVLHVHRARQGSSCPKLLAALASDLLAFTVTGNNSTYLLYVISSLVQENGILRIRAFTYAGVSHKYHTAIRGTRSEAEQFQAFHSFKLWIGCSQAPDNPSMPVQ